MKKYVVYLLAAVMVLSPIAVFADPLTEGQGNEPVVTEDQTGAPAEEQQLVEEPLIEEPVATEDDAVAGHKMGIKGEVDPNVACTWTDNNVRTQAKDSNGDVVKGRLFLGKRFKDGQDKGTSLYYAENDEQGTVKKQAQFIAVSTGWRYTHYQDTEGEYWRAIPDPGTKAYGYAITFHEEFNDYFVHWQKGLITVNGSKYYVQDDGTVKLDPGFVTDGIDTYYVKEGGAVVTDGPAWFDVGNARYYVKDADGRIRKEAGTFDFQGKKWYTDSNGIVKQNSGLVDDGATRYYATADGSIQTTAGFVTVGGKRYLVTNGGPVSKTSGTFKYGSSWYAAASDGSIITTVGITTSGGKYYYVTNTNGVLAINKAVKAGKKTYHAGSNGILAVGVHKYKKKYYYSDSKAVVRTKTGIVKWNGGYYHVKKGGKLTTNKKVKYKKKSYITSKKAKIYTGLFTWKKTKYYASKKGVLKAKAGVITWDGDKYFVRAGGKVAKNATAKAKGKTYHCAKSGKIVIGYHKWTNKKYYLTNADGSLITKAGLYDYKGKTYYVKKGGAMASKSFVDYKGKHYYAGSDGAILKKAFKYNGITITPDSSTGAISEEDYAKVFPKDEPTEV